MSQIIKDITDELKVFVKGNTFDAVIPPLLFIFLQNRFALIIAISISFLFSFLLFLYRIFRKQKWQYSIGGLIGVAIASAFAFIAGNAKDYFLPELVSGLFFSILSLLTLIIKKPLAAWTSHLSRGWNRVWYLRPDILPAYQEVTIFWTIFLFLRLGVLTYVYLNGNAFSLFLSNFILGFPTTLLVLIITYIYGIWRLSRLKGPSIDEFTHLVPPPWKGQKKGF